MHRSQHEIIKYSMEFAEHGWGGWGIILEDNKDKQ